jgi:adenylate cyclase
MHFRIGINSGDVIEEGELIYGDGVNVAARVESLAEGGGISISGTAFDQLGKKLPLGYEYLGEQSVKNIRKPVHVYRVLTEAEAVGKVIGELRPKTKQLRGAAIGAVAVLIIGVGAWAIWNFYFRPAFEPASVERMAYPLPDKPSIAVLPFVNMSDDPKQEYFSDGLTEEIISALSKVPKLFVIARNSTFIYKGKPVKVQQISEELGVRYVLEGGVRKAEDRVRITAQLIDALSGHHLWSERYDRDLKDIFALQDEITKKIITALQVELTQGEQARLFSKGTHDLKAYLKFLKALEHMFRMTKEDNISSRHIAEEVITLDPKFPAAYNLLAATHMMDVWFHTTNSPKESIKQAIQLSRKAIALDDSFAPAHGLLGWLYTMTRQHDKGIAEAKRGVALDPNNSLVLGYLGLALRYAGRFEEAIPVIEKAIRLNPFPPSGTLRSLSMANIGAGRYEEAIAAGKRAVTISPDDFLSHSVLASAYSLAGQKEEARAEAEEVLRINPNYSLEYFEKTLPFKNKADLERHIGACRMAGLPYKPPLPLPDKPSIAVLPFVNMSGDPKQEYFSDGISEEIITALSKSSQLFVIARESSFSYKGKQVNVQQIARELGVRYILEGSMRKSEDRVRITAQLIDGIKGQHLWAERYDRNLQDIFALQDEITMKTVTALRIKLTDGEQARMWVKKMKNLDVLLKSMEAQSLWNKGTKESLIRFGQVAQEIIDMAPESAIGYRLLAWQYWALAMRGRAPRENIPKAFKLGQKALSIDESYSLNHALLGSVHLLMRQYDKAIAAGERSVELAPNGAMEHGLLGMTLSYAGRPDEAIAYLKQGIRLNPFPPYWYFLHLGRCYNIKGQYEEALAELKKAVQLAPGNLISRVAITATYSLLGREEEARAAAKKVLEINPNFSLERARASAARRHKNPADIKHLTAALSKAGLK